MLKHHVIQRLREQRGWDQKRLASESQVNPSVISRLERGVQQDFKLSVVLAIARALNIDISTIVQQDEYETDVVEDLQVAIRRCVIQPHTVQRQIAGMINGLLNVVEHGGD